MQWKQGASAALLTLVTTLGVLAPEDAQAQSFSELTTQGRLGLGAFGTFNFGFISNEVPGTSMGGSQSDTAENSTLFLLLAPELGYFFAPRAQVNFRGGFMTRRLQRAVPDTTGMMQTATSTSANVTDWFVGANVKYYIEATPQFAIVPGAGLAGVFGSSTYQVIVQNEAGNPVPVDSPTSTLGLDINASLMFAYLIGERTSLHAGFDMHYIPSWETIQALQDTGTNVFFISNLNVGLNLGVFYFF